MIKSGTLVRVAKVSASAAPKFRTAEQNEWTPGQENNPDIVPPVNYTIEGRVLGDLDTNQPFRVVREKRNGVEALGMFQTSLVQSIVLDNTGLYTIETENSVYVISILKKVGEDNDFGHSN